MKLATASALILAVCGGASAFSAAPSAASSTALRSTATETYTFAKSEEIFAEAKTVSWKNKCQNVWSSVNLLDN